jgi:Mrp family chromosome partitioning ATPase/capsular polysaccharide biosynthesis protein
MSPASERELGFEPPRHSEGGAAGGLLGAIRRHPLLIAIVSVQVAIVALLWSAAREREYEASAQVLVTPLPEDGGSDPRLPVLRTSSDRTRVVQTAANLLDSPDASAIASRRLGPGFSAGRVEGMVDVLPEGESDVLAVTAKADDPEVAARVANEYARAALEARGRVLAPVIESLTAQTARELNAQEDRRSPVALALAERLSDLRALGTGVDPTLSLSRRAEAPSSPLGPSSAVLALIGLLAGIAVGVGSALVLDMLGPPRIGSAEHAVATTGLPVLARVPGLSLLDRARRPPTLRFRPGAAAALRTLQHQLEFEPGTRRRLLFAGSSAGDGVTTSVAEFGMTLARAGHSVLLVDLDTRNPQLASRLGVTQPSTLAVASVPGTPGLKVTSAGAHGSLGLPDDAAEELLEVLAEARRRFDYVLIDAPPLAESGEALRVTSAVEAVVLVLRPGRTSLPDLEIALQLLERAKRRPAGMLLVGGRPSAPPAGALVGARRSAHAPGAAPVGQSAEA